MKPNHRQDDVLTICRKLLQIDNRPPADIAESCDLCSATIQRIRDGKGEYIFSSTASAIARGTNKKWTTR